MKHLLMLLAFSVFVQNAIAQTTVPQCMVLSVSHFGGNKSDEILPAPQINNIMTDSTFKVAISTNSTVGNINTNCPTGAYFQTYDANTLTVINETCEPIGTNFQRPTSYVFPQANGDTILFGQSTDSLGNYGIERRDAFGNVLWTKTYGSPGDDGFVSVIPTIDGSGFFINGGSNDSGGDVNLHYGNGFSYDIWIVKVNNDGNLIWSKVIGGTGNDNIGDMVPADDGGLYLFGLSDSDDHDVTGNHGGYDLYIAKLDSTGNLVWHHCYGGSNNDGGQHFKAIKDGTGGFYVGTSTASSDGDVQHRPATAFDFWLLHVDSGGTLLWENTYGGPGWEMMYDMCRATDGSIWMGGITEGGNIPESVVGGDVQFGYGWKDAWVAHVDTAGGLINSCTMGNYGDDYLLVLQPLPNGKVMAGGFYSNLRSDTDTFAASPGFPKHTYGDDWFDIDIYLAKLGPENDLGIQEQYRRVAPWALFPNPARHQVTINIENDTRKYRIIISDANGREVFKDKFRSDINIPIQNFSDGIYWVTISHKGASDTKKLIIKK